MASTTLVLRHIRFRPLRTLLTVGALGFSVGLIGFLVLLKGGLEKDWSPLQAQRAIVTAKSSMFERLPMAYLAKLEDVPGVQAVAPFDFLMGFVGDNRPENQVPVGGAPPDTLLTVYAEVDVPEDQRKAFLADRQGALLGPLLARKYGWKIGERHVVKAPVRGGVLEFNVRAIMRYELDNGVYLHRKYLEGYLDDPDLTGMFWILAKSRDVVQPVTAEIERRLDNAPVPIRAMTEKGWQLQWMSMIGNVKLLIGSIGLATAFAVLLITGNTLAMNARERRGEAALLRILGFSRPSIARTLLIEAAVLGVLGAVAGCLLMKGFAMLLGVGLTGTMYEPLAGLVTPDAMAVVIAFVVSITLAVVSGLLPALDLTRRPIVQLLREAT